MSVLRNKIKLLYIYNYHHIKNIKLQFFDPIYVKTLKLDYLLELIASKRSKVFFIRYTVTILLSDPSNFQIKTVIIITMTYQITLMHTANNNKVLLPL